MEPLKQVRIYSVFSKPADSIMEEASTNSINFMLDKKNKLEIQKLMKGGAQRGSMQRAL